jgi:hypothetical protein
VEQERNREGTERPRARGRDEGVTAQARRPCGARRG